MYRVTDQPIDVEAMIKSVDDPRSGAIVTFLGVVRGFSQGKKVNYLEYEAFDEMAIKKMAEIGAETKEKWGVDKIAVTHRVGRLEIGEASIVIALSTPHRKEGFEACHYTIDRIKEIVPVWKKEVWEDGEVWVEGHKPI